MVNRTSRTSLATRTREANPYDVLQVSPQASAEVIKAAYRVLARGSHPDVNDAKDATRRMRQINAAYEVLNDPARRAAYDARARAERVPQLRRVQVRERTPHVEGRSRPGLAAHRHTPPSVSRPSGPTRGALLVTLLALTFVIVSMVIAWWAISDALDENVVTGAVTEVIQAAAADRGPLSQIFAGSPLPDANLAAQPFLNPR